MALFYMMGVEFFKKALNLLKLLKSNYFSSLKN